MVSPVTQHVPASPYDNCSVIRSKCFLLVSISIKQTPVKTFSEGCLSLPTQFQPVLVHVSSDFSSSVKIQITEHKISPGKSTISRNTHKIHSYFKNP